MKIELLISAYLDAVGDCISELLDVYSCRDNPVHDLFGAWRERRIPTSGKLPSGRAFAFHDQGCRFVHRRMAVEVGFTPDGRCDGFDASRLDEFSATNPQFGRPISTEIAATLKDLEHLGVVELPSNSTLYVLRRLK